jgi:hypothetical protein
MTPQQVIKHYDNSTTFAGYNLGFSEAAVKKWVADDRIPRRTQVLIENLTGGKLKADKVKK